MKGEPLILFFDGVCNLCNGFVDFMVRHDPQARLRFAPLQGETAERLIPDDAQRLGSIVAYRDGVTKRESAAVLAALREVGGWPSLGAAAAIIPAFFRDPVYRFVARHRYRWFGQRDTCRLPTPEERARFLP